MEPKLLPPWMIHIVVDIGGNKTTTSFLTTKRFLHSENAPFYFC